MGVSRLGSEMAGSFRIIVPTRSVDLDAAGHGEATFSVLNIAPSTLRARVRAVPLDEIPGEWVNVLGEREHDLVPDQPRPYVASIDVPPGSPGGTYRFRLDAMSVARPDDDFTQGPTMMFTVAEGLPPPPRRAIPWIPIAIAGIIGVVVLAVVAIAALVFARPSDNVAIPAVATLPEPKAMAALTGACLPEPCFKVTTTREDGPLANDGQALRSEPAAGSRVARGSAVKLVVSQAQRLPIPEVTGSTDADARAALESACAPAPCFRVESRQEQVDAGASGIVLRSEPVSGTTVDRGSLVTLVVAHAASTVSLPDVTGKSEADATALLLGACAPSPCVQVAISREFAEANPGTAIRSLPAAGTVVQKGSTVSVVVSRGLGSVVSYELLLRTADLNWGQTWGDIEVRLGLLDGSWRTLFHKPAHSTNPPDAPGVRAGELSPRHSTLLDISTGDAIGIDPAEIERIRVVWSEDNIADWWAFKGIRIRYVVESRPGLTTLYEQIVPVDITTDTNMLFRFDDGVDVSWGDDVE